MKRPVLSLLLLVSATQHGAGQHWQAAADSAGRYLDKLLYHQAHPCAERALAAWPAVQRDTAYARCLGYLAEAEIYTLRPQAAFDHASESLTAWAQTTGPQTLDYARARQRRAGALQELERFAEAETDHAEALTLTARLAGERSLAHAAALGRSGVLYRMMGLREKAKTRLAEALRLFESLGKTKCLDYAVTAKHLAETPLFLSNVPPDYRNAQGLLRQSLQTLMDLGCRESIVGAEALRSLASANLFEYKYTGRFTEAPDSLVRVALAVLKTTVGDDSPNYSVCLTWLNSCLTYLGQHRQATEVQEQVYQRLARVLPPTHIDLTDVQASLCRGYVRLGRYAEAEPLARRVNQNLLNELRIYTASLGDDERERVHANVIGNFEEFHTLARLFGTHNPAIAADQYDNQLAIKGFLLQAGQSVRQRVTASRDTSLQRIHTRWLASRETLARASRLSQAQLAHQHLRLDSLESSAIALDEALSRRLGREVEATHPTWRDVQRTLRPGEAALELVRYRTHALLRRLNELTDTVHYAALLVTPGCAYPAVVVLENGNALEGPLLRAYQSDIQNQTHLADSYAHFWAPLGAVLHGVKRLYFSPDGVYHGLNVQTLRNPESGRYVFDELDVVLVTSTRELLRNPAPPATENRTAVLFGAPDFGEFPGERLAVNAPRRGSTFRLSRGHRYEALPGARREVEAIAALLRGRMPVRVFTDGQAREETLKTVAAPRLLHVATHGFLETDTSMGGATQSPMLRSGLVLAGANHVLRDPLHSDIFDKTRRDDGLLTAYEAANLDLTGTDLVVLSACQTALGEQPRSGEGVYGLQRAFRVAGANALLMSLWKVDDEATRLLMTQFYRHWLQTGDKARAFRLAQQALRRQYPEPFYWGAFVLVGG